MIQSLLTGIPREDLLTFHERVLHLVENTGMQVDHEGILARLSDFDGVTIRNGRVTFAADLVNKHVFNIEYDMPPYFDEDDYLVISGNMNPTIKDTRAGQIREATVADLVRVTKLEDSYGVTGSASVTPTDVPKHLREICLHRTLWENSRFKGNDIFEHNPKSTLPSCQYIREMAQVLEKRFTVGLWVRSPWTFNRFELDIVYHYLDSDVPMWVGNFPLFGITTPIFIESGMAQAAAELFSGYTMLKLLRGSRPVYLQVIDSIMGHPVDWRFAHPVFSSIEDTMKTVYQVSLNRFYSIPLVGLTLHGAGKGVDFQQGFEKAVHTFVAALLGVRAFRNAGYLALDMVYSPEQLVCDCEMVRFLQQLVEHRRFDVERIMVDEIGKVEPGGSFIADELTLARFREEYRDPGFFDRSPVNHWLSHGSMTIEERAHEMVEQRIKDHEFELADGQQSKIDRIYDRASRDEALIDSFR